MEDRFVHQLQLALKECDKRRTVPINRIMKYFAPSIVQSTVSLQLDATTKSLCVFFSIWDSFLETSRAQRDRNHVTAQILAASSIVLGG